MGILTHGNTAFTLKMGHGAYMIVLGHGKLYIRCMIIPQNGFIAPWTFCKTIYNNFQHLNALFMFLWFILADFTIQSIAHIIKPNQFESEFMCSIQRWLLVSPLQRVSEFITKISSGQYPDIKLDYIYLYSKENWSWYSNKNSIKIKSYDPMTSVASYANHTCMMSHRNLTKFDFTWKMLL